MAKKITMNLQPLNINIKKNRLDLIAAASILVAAVGKDIIHAHLNNYHVYLSESILFETFWLIFIPFLIWTKPIQKKVDKLQSILFVLLLSLIHIIIFSALVFIVSALLFDHTFGFSRLFIKTFAQNGMSCLFIYGLAGLYFQLNRPNYKTHQKNPATVIKLMHRNKTILVNIADIIYIKSETPYIKLITGEQTMLYNHTLKGFLEEKASDNFIRIHKSTIINMAFVKSYQSRKNGDYDVILTNGKMLRISRNYSKDFKSHF